MPNELELSIQSLEESRLSADQASRSLLPWSRPTIPGAQGFPRPGPEDPDYASVGRQKILEVPKLSPEELLDKWRTNGAAYIIGLPPKQREEVLRLMGHQVGGVPLYTEPGLWAVVEAESQKIPLRRRLRLLTAVVFRLWPVPPPLLEALFRWGQETRQQPAWLKPFQSQGNNMPLFVGASLLSTGSTFRGLANLELPDEILGGAWRLPMVQRQGIQNVVQAVQLLRLADGLPEDAPPPGRSTLSDAVYAAAKVLVALGDKKPDLRATLARLLIDRIADLYNPAQKSRWSPIPEVLRALRSWVAGPFLEVFFSHLVPREHQQTTEKRKTFWAPKSGYISRLYLFVTPSYWNIFRQPAIEKLMEQLGSLVTVGLLSGHIPEGALLWMVLEGTEGENVSFIEWNASAAARWVSGNVDPTNRKILSNGTAPDGKRVKRIAAADARDSFPYSHRILHTQSSSRQNWAYELKQILNHHGVP